MKTGLESALFMVGTRFYNHAVNWTWIQISAAVAFAALVCGAVKGPVVAIVLTGVGLFAAGLSLLFRLISPPARFPGSGAVFAAVAANLVVFSLAVAARARFLDPLPPRSERVPSLSRRYVDPGGSFSIRGPVGWTYTLVSGPVESGVKIHPVAKEDYVGASEIQVWVRPLDHAPDSHDLFLETMASSMTPPARDGKRVFQSRTESTRLSDGGPGLFSIIDLKWYWIPFRQVTLYAMTNDRVLCSVSISGLRSHSRLFKTIALELFETLRAPARASTIKNVEITTPAEIQS